MINLLPLMDPNIRDARGRTPLHYAVEKNNVAVTHALLGNARTKIDLTDSQGETPLTLAGTYGDQTMNLLLNNAQSTRQAPYSVNTEPAVVPHEMPDRSRKAPEEEEKFIFNESAVEEDPSTNIIPSLTNANSGARLTPADNVVIFSSTLATSGLL